MEQAEAGLRCTSERRVPKMLEPAMKRKMQNICTNIKESHSVFVLAIAVRSNTAEEAVLSAFADH
jgi:hypothetical protein